MTAMGISYFTLWIYGVHHLLRPDADPALFASLSEVVGRPINEYAFGDIPALAATIDRVLAWHAANDDPFTHLRGGRRTG